MGKQNFHHGNLRADLIQAAVETVQKFGVEKLSLRQLAEELGVSSAAPYRHFKNKNALIAELIELGASEMSQAYRKAYESSQDPEHRLYKGCEAYIRYAAEKTNMFNLLFSDYSKLSVNLTRTLADNETFQLFQNLVAEVIPAHLDKSGYREITISCWALMHGFATLHIGGNLETADYKMDNAILAVIKFAQSAR